MTTKKARTQLLQALTAAGGSARESELRAATGWDAERLAIVLEDARERLLARPVATKPQKDTAWVAVDVLIARCPWKPARILKALTGQEMSTRELAELAQSPELAMGLVLRRMARAQRIKLAAFNGHRKWVPFGRYIAPGGSRPEPYDGDLLALIAQHQPMRLEHLAELTGRGRVYTRQRVHKLRRAGKVNIRGVDGSWRYVLPDYVRTPADIEQEILLRCEPVGCDCLRWSGARSPQGHPLTRHDGNVKRVDIVLWTAVHGKELKKGHTLTGTCETPGCCNHEHHKQVTRGAAMRKAFASIGFGGEKHGRLVSAAIRHKVGSLSPEQVELIRTSPLTGAELARQLGKTKSVVQDARAGRSYRDYVVASPFAGLGGRSAC
ncbi:hypothetical protein QRO08_09660 [Paracidovorax citrulli]|uniref:Uncharacterized protein n=2 Tax=Paracidovorax citrulli TaxID=80869 RepID=A1TPN0_PARC0|nr:hypothetical protein [Paracidovorax citrulli]ABM32918.1 hypothetical protein Aave_2343 [Paracidovorax citrulli AAC00-1]ATG93113.1 hypothetical protein CQB05_02840 [Paracidovorax citrulli]PVY67135.1 hypothetical protein C8E08_4570 [Paracidovorax citrulli]REG68702.1 hypothetical protein C8E07_1821 [Paracidovorax citrulli]RLJ93257.1 hypothetical protein C8E06_1821 [Paracidovorax citrulli]